MEKHIIGYSSLAPWWSCYDGLKFPLEIVTLSGKTLIFNTYQEYHEFIKNKFMGAKINH